MHLPEVFLRRTLAIEASGIDFLVAVLLENVEDGGGFFKGVDTSLFNARLEASVSEGTRVRAKTEIPCQWS
jgi:hypothetical protein